MDFAAVLIFALPVAFATCPGNGSLSDYDVRHVLNIHNLWRGEAATGNLFTDNRHLPAGENIYKMEWDCALEELAKKAVAKCPKTRTVNPAHGQAFMHFNASANNLDKSKALNVSLSLWPDPIDTDDIGNDVVNMGDDKFLDFMNMIRANTYQVGCAQKTCNKRATAICFYNQPDLKKGDLVYKAGRNCTGGGQCTTYPSSTCDSTFSLCVRGTAAPGATSTVATTTVASSQVETMPAPSAQNKLCPRNQGMIDLIRSRFLDMHNIRRSALASGQATTARNAKLLRSSNMMKLRWDCTLEAAALTHARTCTFAKSSESSRPSDGENQATINAASNYQAAVEEAVRSWWKTIRTIGGVGKDRVFKQSFVGTPIEGFTQMAWANTRKLGCAVVKCSGRYNVVCRYNEKGNTVGQVIYNRGISCSQCPPRTRCVDSMCQ